MKQVFYFVILLIFYSCGRTVSLEESIYPKPSTQQLKLSVDSFYISNSVYDSVGFNFLQAKVLNDSLYLFIMNSDNKKFEVYNLDNLTKVWELRHDNLLDSFHNSQKLWSVDFHNLDTIVLHSEYTIVLVNREKIIYQRIINEPEAMENPPYSLFSMLIPTVWDNQRLGFWIQGYCSVCDAKAGDRYYKTPIEVFIPIDSTQKWDTLPITFPDRYYKQEQGFNNWVYRLKVDNKHIYSFAAEPNLYALDLTTKAITVIPARSKSDTVAPPTFTKKEVEDADIKLGKLATTSQYNQVLYDPYRNLYYRFYIPALPEKDEDGLYNSFADKRVILMVFDQNFNLIGEYLLPKQKLAHYHAFVGKKGLYFTHYFPKGYTSDYEHKFSIYSFN